jgi:hypothetical protein
VTTALVVLVGCGPGAVEVEPPAVEGVVAERCDELAAALPDRVAGLERREVEPSDAAAAAWGDPPVVLICGGEAPDGFDRTATCTTVNGVDWYLPAEQVAVDDPGDVTMTTVNREAFVRVRLPEEYWPPAETMVDLADAVSSILEATGRCR